MNFKDRRNIKKNIKNALGEESVRLHAENYNDIISRGWGVLPSYLEIVAESIRLPNNTDVQVLGVDVKDTSNMSYGGGATRLIDAATFGMHVLKTQEDVQLLNWYGGLARDVKSVLKAIENISSNVEYNTEKNVVKNRQQLAKFIIDKSRYEIDGRLFVSNVDFSGAKKKGVLSVELYDSRLVDLSHAVRKENAIETTRGRVKDYLSNSTTASKEFQGPIINSINDLDEELKKIPLNVKSNYVLSVYNKLRSLGL